MVSCYEPGGPDSAPALPFARQVPFCAWASAARPTPFSHFPGTWDPNRAKGSPAARGSQPALRLSPWAMACERALWSWGHTCSLETASSPVETEPCFPDFSRLVLVQEGDLPDILGRDPPGPPVPPRGLGDAARLPRACPHTPGQPLSTPRRPQSWAPRASSQAGSPGPCRGVRVTQGPACPWCQLRGRGRATAPGPASQPSPPEPHAQVSPTRAPAQPLPLPRQAHAGTHTDPQTRGDAHAHGVTDTQTHACPQPPGRYFLIISHVASAIKFFN